jgi:raffinose synthase
MTFVVSDQNLCHAGCILIAGLNKEISLEATSGSDDAFLVASKGNTGSRLVFELGRLPALQRFTLCHRYEPYWMKPKVGTQIKDVPPETQFLLGELTDGKWVLCVPLLDDPFRFSLRGRSDQQLELLAETGDPYTVGNGGLALYIAHGSDPFELLERGAKRVNDRLGLGKLRTEKSLPDFTDYFGWCTWDAFYQDVSAENVRAGLEQFARGGVEPRFLILDDGWQSTELKPTGETRLTDFKPNQKFNGELRTTVNLAKNEFQVKVFLVWHTIVGYWGGVDGEKLSDYGVSDQTRRFGEGIMAHAPKFNEDWWGSLVGFISPNKIAQFYDDYHSYLQSQGVDGVKVDSQALLEAISEGHGGRVRVTLSYREALEKSVSAHFAGRLINCMSNAQETWYGSPSSTLLRSSIDFFPRFPDSHGLHVYTNAQVGLWFGQFMRPDWDMFQSGHEWGAYHAAGRAISGGPIYVSDKPGVHDFNLLRKLVCSDGAVLRCDGPAVPTLDTLCVDPTVDDALLKIWNRNGKSGILGVFNAKWDKSNPSASRPTAGFKPADVRGILGARFACYAHLSQSLTLLNAEQEQWLSLGPGEFELIVIAPIENDFAPIGLADKFNSAGALAEVAWPSESVCELTVRDSGAFLAYADRRPHSIQLNDLEVEYQFDGATHALRVAITKPGVNRVRIAWLPERLAKV